MGAIPVFFMFVGCVGMVGMPCPPIVWLRGYGRDAIPSYIRDAS